MERGMGRKGDPWGGGGKQTQNMEGGGKGNKKGRGRRAVGGGVARGEWKNQNKRGKMWNLSWQKLVKLGRVTVLPCVFFSETSSSRRAMLKEKDMRAFATWLRVHNVGSDWPRVSSMGTDACLQRSQSSSINRSASPTSHLYPHCSQTHYRINLMIARYGAKSGIGPRGGMASSWELLTSLKSITRQGYRRYLVSWQPAIWHPYDNRCESFFA